MKRQNWPRFACRRGDDAKQGLGRAYRGGMTGMVKRAGLMLAAGMLLVTGATSAGAAGGPVSIGGVTGTYSVPDVARFDGPGCARVPWVFNYQRPPRHEITVRLSMVQPGSNSPVSDTDWVERSDPDVGTAPLTMCIEDTFDPSRGPYTLTGSISVEDSDYNSLGAFPLPPASISVERNPTRIVALKAKATTPRRLATVKARITATTTTKGSIGADGDVVIEIRRKGKWRTLRTAIWPDEFGRFTESMYEDVPAGARLRVRLSGCGWCTDAKATVRAR